MTPKIQGKDFNFFTKINVTDTTFPTEAQVVIPFAGQIGFSLMNEGGAVIEYSFNGTTLHGDLTPGSSSASITFSNRRIPAIWLRSSTSCLVRIEAWAGI